MKCQCCESENIIIFGKNSKGNQRYRCKNCHSVFLENPEHKWLSEEEKIIIQKLAKEGLSERGISRFLGRGHVAIHNFLKKTTNEVL